MLCLYIFMFRIKYWVCILKIYLIVWLKYELYVVVDNNNDLFVLIEFVRWSLNELLILVIKFGNSILSGMIYNLV